MLRGVHDSRIPLIIALIGYWAIGAPVAIALGFATPLGAVGVWIGLALGLAVVAILLMSRWLAKERRGFRGLTLGRPSGHNVPPHSTAIEAGS